MVILVKPSILVAAFLSFATDDVEAFFPSSSFVCKRCSKQVSSVVSGKCVHPLSGLRYSARRSCLSMNLFDRFQRVAKSNLNNLLKIMEDPEKIMNQAVEDMQVGSLICHSLTKEFTSQMFVDYIHTQRKSSCSLLFMRNVMHAICLS